MAMVLKVILRVRTRCRLVALGEAGQESASRIEDADSKAAFDSMNSVELLSRQILAKNDPLRVILK